MDERSAEGREGRRLADRLADEPPLGGPARDDPWVLEEGRRLDLTLGAPRRYSNAREAGCGACLAILLCVAVAALTLSTGSRGGPGRAGGS